MFENLDRKLKELKRAQLSIPVSIDEKGYYDKECPNPACLFQFKVRADDWKNLFSDDAVYCPKCRHEAPAQSWWTTKQIEEGKRQAIKHIRGLIGEALHHDAREFNRQQPKSGFITMSMNASGCSRMHIVVPIPAQKEMQLEIQCEKCNANFAVIGSAFFCPCCGYNSVERTFDDSIKKVATKVNNLTVIRQAFQAVDQIDEGEITCLSLVETSLSDCVVAFQRFSEETFRKFTNNGTNVPFNAFQRLDTGSNLWKSALNEGYEDWLTANELFNLNVLFQKRHLLAHCEGIVDDKYVQKSQDTSYQLGQRIVVKEKDVLYLISLIQKLATNIRLKVKQP